MDINQKLKQEIDALMSKYRFYELLEAYGQVSIVGSYNYDLMAWRDFDLVLELEEYTNTKVDGLVAQINKEAEPSEIKISNNLEGKKKNRPKGIWLGVYLEGWKIDLWLMDEQNARREVQKNEKLKNMLKNINKEKLIPIKQELAKDPNYHIKFSSVDLYYAFVEGGVRSTKEFYDWLKIQEQL